MIAYLDMPSGISGDMFLGCLIDAGWPVDALRTTIEQMALPADLWSVQADTVMRGALRATLVNVHAAEDAQHRHLSDVCKIIQAGNLPETVQNRAIAVFTRLAQAEAGVHGSTIEEVHFMKSVRSMRSSTLLVSAPVCMPWGSNGSMPLVCPWVKAGR